MVGNFDLSSDRIRKEWFGVRYCPWDMARLYVHLAQQVELNC